MIRLAVTAMLALLVSLAWAAEGLAQGTLPSTGSPGQMPVPLYSGIARTSGGVEVSLDGRIGYPEGSLKVGEGSAHATRLRLHEDLGIAVSEALEGSVAVNVTPRDAIRATALYYFLDGGDLFSAPIVYNGQSFGPGHVHANADFYRMSLAYERRLASGPGGFLTGIVGLTYVHLDPKISSRGRSNSEDFYRQELPVPIAGLRADVPLDPHFGVRASLSGGGLPRVDSGRKEGGTVYLTQTHVDAAVALTYAISGAVMVEAGYNFTYFMQHEKSHEDDNRFELSDNALHLGVNVAF